MGSSAVIVGIMPADLWNPDAATGLPGGCSGSNFRISDQYLERGEENGPSTGEPSGTAIPGSRRGGMEMPLSGETVAAILADDLTGACDAAVHFAVRGLRTWVAIDPGERFDHPAQVMAYNTETRCSREIHSAERVVQALSVARELRPRLLMKKIDSTMRGQAGQEIAVMLHQLQLLLAIVAPAFPGAGRTVRNGHIVVQGSEQSIDIAACLPELQSAHVAKQELGTLRERVLEETGKGTRVLIVDAEDDADLLRIAHLQQEGHNVLWAGSGGLAQALAAEYAGDIQPVARPEGDGPVLVCVGSAHGVTAAQLQRLCGNADVMRVSASEAGYAMAQVALREGRHVVLEFSRARIDSAPDRGLGDKVGVRSCGGMVATGGDTAMYVLRSLGAEAIALRAEMQPGIPWGEIVGGAANGKPLITKSGAFGQSEALLACVDFLNSSAARGQKADVL